MNPCIPPITRFTSNIIMGTTNIIFKDFIKLIIKYAAMANKLTIVTTIVSLNLSHIFNLKDSKLFHCPMNFSYVLEASKEVGVYYPMRIT